MKGRWVVNTEFSTHLFDLDAHTYERRVSGNRMRRDQEILPLPIDCIIRWPQVGEVFEIVVSVDSYSGYVGTLRTSSVVRSIEEGGGL